MHNWETYFKYKSSLSQLRWRAVSTLWKREKCVIKWARRTHFPRAPKAIFLSHYWLHAHDTYKSLQIPPSKAALLYLLPLLNIHITNPPYLPFWFSTHLIFVKNRSKRKKMHINNWRNKIKIISSKSS